ITEGRASFHTLEQYALNNKTIKNESGKQERLKAILNQYILEV
ncbi:hypothetical protein MOB38_20790, partial [Bacillus spizizenii]|nr:hypothetical protein [Bacillus spizizenii]